MPEPSPASYADLLRRHDETFPYPHSTPESPMAEPGGIPFLVHYNYGGRMPREVRTLVAGGGTGNGTLTLAEQYAEYDLRGEIVHVDLSMASMAIAKARLEHFGLLDKVRVRFVRHDLLKLHELELGTFDFINSSGVIHHLPSPGDALSILREHLADTGALYLMVYASIGRTGIYPLQEVMRRLIGTVEPLEERVALARKLLAALPETNSYRRNVPIGGNAPAYSNSDAEIYDRLLHSSDVSYTLTEFRHLVVRAGLGIRTFLEPTIYDLRNYIKDPDILERAPHHFLDRAVLAEKVAGNILMHRALLMKQGRTAPPLPGIGPDAIPTITRDFENNRGLAPGPIFGVWQFGAQYCSRPMRVPLLVHEIILEIDGRSTLREIHARLDRRGISVSPEQFQNAFTDLYEFLHGISQLFLRFE